MIIWGTRNREFKTGQGFFYCPACNQQRQYTQKSVRRYFTLYFIPLFPLGKPMAEFVECQYCNHPFANNALSYQPPSQHEQAIAMAKQDLATGTPAQMVQQKMLNAGLEKNMAEQILQAALGKFPKHCNNCKLDFSESIGKCSNCGQTIT